MRRITAAVALTMLALPASAAAAGSSGIVLSVDSGRHRLEVVDSAHVVHDYSYRGRLPGLLTGTPISFARHGSTISRVKPAAGPAQRSRRVSYYARVVRCTRQGLVLALADGQRMRFSAGQLGHKRLGLRSGVTVMVAETLERHGSVAITITLPTPSPPLPGSPTPSGQQPAVGPTGPDQDESGTITQVSGTGLTVATQDNGSMTFSVDSSDITDGYAVGDVVDVTYNQTSGASLDAWDVEYVEQEATGPVSAVSGASVTLTDDTTGQPVTITADPSDAMFDGVAIGDQLDVTYHQSGSQLVADQVDDSGPLS